MENTFDTANQSLEKLSFESFRNEVLQDYRWVCISREISLMGRKEVLTGKAKFGIFGDGKELAQVAMAKFFQPGDFRAGYYRDQTFMLASGLCSIEQFFAQLYADPYLENDPFSAGRQMDAHFATPFVDDEGNWVDLVNRKNISADIAPTAGQMPRALGLAYASKTFRNVPILKEFTNLSNNGNEVCFCTIGDASTSEGPFWEAINAAGVLQVPLVVFVWDDGYGISVPKKYQTTKGSISEALRGMEKGNGMTGFHIYKVKGWDYADMCEQFEEGVRLARETHTPVIFHVDELTQPQGHSTSGSHERYKSADRLAWEKEWDGMKKMREWILANTLADEEELSMIEFNSKDEVRKGRLKAWETFLNPIKDQVKRLIDLLNSELNHIGGDGLTSLIKEIQSIREPQRRDVMRILHAAIEITEKNTSPELYAFYEELKNDNASLFNSHLYNEGAKSTLHVTENKAFYATDAPSINGFEVLNRYFDQLFAMNPKVIAFGEDVGFIGDVNQAFAGLQNKYGDGRIFDTGIRELTIMGQGIGMAMRGLRPIAEIQYIDYLLYGLQTLSDDAATLHYRTKGQQSCPLIVRTRGHRLEGIWHSGSPMSVVMNSLRGMYVCVPRNMTQAVGMYNTLLKGNDPGIVIECLNGYRLKEKLPSNLSEITVALGMPEVLREGNDITIVSYGSTLRIVMEAADILSRQQIDCEIIDIQTLIPFDRESRIVESLKKTNRIAFIDEDVPGGCAAYMFNEVLEKQGGYRWLDVAPRTISAKAHRPSYGSDGDYFSKPNVEEVIDVLKAMMKE